MQHKTIEQVINDAVALDPDFPEMNEREKLIAKAFYKIGFMDAEMQALNSMELGQ